jgi:hypothetical protein
LQNESEPRFSDPNPLEPPSESKRLGAILRRFWHAVLGSALLSGLVVGLHYTVGPFEQLTEYLPPIPPNALPWGEIELDEKPYWFAKIQLTRLSGDSEICFSALDRSRLEYRRLDDRKISEGCGVESRTEIRRSRIPYSAGFESTCALAASLYWYEQRLEVLAEEYLGSGIARIEHFGTYACRNIYGRANARRSAHATAEAIDIAGFRLEDGREISILTHWSSTGPAGIFLREARDEACRFFGPVLSPDYNRAHANHFHLEVGGYGPCR